MEAWQSFMGVSFSQPSSPRTPSCWTVQSAVAEDLELNRTRCQQQVRAQNAHDLAAVFEHAEPQAMADYRDHLTGLSGARSLSRWVDLRTDVPGYRIYRKGELADQRGDIRDVRRDDLVAFLQGCSFTFE